MVTLAAAAVVLIPFPFSDLSQSKLRPAVVLANSGRGDWVLCQVTSKPYGDRRAVPVTDHDFTTGSLNYHSYARPGKLFTASDNLMVSRVGVLTQQSFERVIEAVVDLLLSHHRS